MIHTFASHHQTMEILLWSTKCIINIWSCLDNSTILLMSLIHLISCNIYLSHVSEALSIFYMIFFRIFYFQITLWDLFLCQQHQHSWNKLYLQQLDSFLFLFSWVLLWNRMVRSLSTINWTPFFPLYHCVTCLKAKQNNCMKIDK